MLFICFSLIFPFVFSIFVVKAINANDESIKQGFSFVSYFCTMPTNFIIYIISDLLKFDDPYSFTENFIAGTIQYSCITYFIVDKYIKKKK